MTLDLSASSKNGELMHHLKQELFIANTQIFLTKATKVCFNKCVSNKPGAILDSSEQKCIAMCTDRFRESWNLVSRVYRQRVQREQSNM